MSKHIVLTEADRQRLEELIASEFADMVSPADNLNDLRTELARARIVPADCVPKGIVVMNSTVTLQDLDSMECETYTLVYPSHADIANGKLSVLAPIGTAVLGQQVGDKLRWRVPGGVRRLKIEHVVNQTDLDEKTQSVMQYAS